MDPDAALDELLELTDRLTQLSDRTIQLHEADVRRLAELIDALDGWLMIGGYLPRR